MTWIAWDGSTAPTEIAGSTPERRRVVPETCNRCKAPWTGAEYARDVLAALNSTDSFAAVLNVVASQAMELLAPTAVIIGKTEPATQTLLVQAAQGSYADACIDNLLLLSAEALRRALAARSQLLFTDDGGNTNHASRLASLPDALPRAAGRSHRGPGLRAARRDVLVLSLLAAAICRRNWNWRCCLGRK